MLSGWDRHLGEISFCVFVAMISELVIWLPLILRVRRSSALPAFDMEDSLMVAVRIWRPDKGNYRLPMQNKDL